MFAFNNSHHVPKTPIVVRSPVVTQRGVRVIVVKDNVKKLLAYFTLRFKNMKGRIEMLRLATKDGAVVSKKTTLETEPDGDTRLYVLLPRAGFIEAVRIGALVVRGNALVNQLPLGDKFKGKSSVVYRDDQQLVTDEIMKTFTSEKRRTAESLLTLDLKAGYGKTEIACSLVGKVGRKTLIIVPFSSIIKQWRDTLHRHYPGIRVGVYSGEEKTDGDVVIAICNSLMCTSKRIPATAAIVGRAAVKGKKATATTKAVKAKKAVIAQPAKKAYTQKKVFWPNGDKKPSMTPSEFFAQFGFAVFDESHKHCTLLRITDMFRWMGIRTQLGLSATPDKNSSGYDRAAHDHVGQVLVASEIPGYKGLKIKFTGYVRRVKYTAAPKYSGTVLDATGMCSVPLTLNKLLEDPHRELMVVDEIMQCLSDKHYVIVFADRREYLCKIAKMLSGKHPVKSTVTDNIRADVVYGGSTHESLQDAKDHAHVIFSTFAYGSTGLSIKKLDAIVMVTPRKNMMEQIVGRIQRINGDMSIKRKIVDIVDIGSSMKKQASTRAIYYEKSCFPVTDVNVLWSKYKIKEPKVTAPVFGSAAYFAALLTTPVINK